MLVTFAKNWPFLYNVLFSCSQVFLGRRETMDTGAVSQYDWPYTMFNLQK